MVESLMHLSSDVYYTTQASIHPSTDTRKLAVPGCLGLSSLHTATTVTCTHLSAIKDTFFGILVKIA